MKSYWAIWAVLLVLTVVMLWADTVAMPAFALAIFMVTAMLTKASLIGGVFMHLARERALLVATVAVGLLVTAVVLFVLIVPDAIRIHEMTATYGPH